MNSVANQITNMVYGAMDEVSFMRSGSPWGDKDPQTRILGEGGPAFAVHLLVTDLTSGEQMVKFAEDEKIDQIFIGIIKKSKVGKFLFGSTAQYVILHGPCPVVTIQEYAPK